MALTRAYAETILVARLKSLLTEASMAVTYGGTNADLNEPLAWAARRMGLSPATPTTVTNSDLSGLAADDYDDYLDLAEYRTLKNILGRLAALVDLTAGPRSEKFSQLAVRVQAMLDNMRPDIDAISRPVTDGYIALDFVAVD